MASGTARLGLHDAYEALVERSSEQSVRWRSLGALYLAGGLLAYASLAVPHPAGMLVAAIAALAGVACAGGVLMLVLGDRLPPTGHAAALALGAALVSGAVYFSHDPGSSYSLYYPWVGFEAFFFLSRRQAFAQLGLVAVLYGWVLEALPGAAPGDTSRWLMLIGTVAVIGGLAGVLRERSERLIHKLEDAARSDPLTGLLNRRGFEERIELELERARRADHGLSVIVGDLDHFKELNDRYGHSTGDRVLQRFAALCSEAGRRIDAIARIGGEEFALVLPHTDEHGAFLVAERLRRHVRKTFEAEGLPVTVSFGVTAFPRDGFAPEELVHAGDQALYVAKLLGRDRTVIYSAEVAETLAGSRRADRPGTEQVAAVLVLAETLDLRDSGTASHSHTVSRYAALIAERLGLDADRVERIRLAGLMHDIGKIGINDRILRKPGPLNQAEWAEMRKHPELGARIIAGANFDDIAAWVLAHHERLDGHGYPSGVTAAYIPIEARILSVADSYEAMTSDRVYRPGLAPAEAEAELVRGSGTQFDPEVVEALLGALRVDTCVLAA